MAVRFCVLRRWRHKNALSCIIIITSTHKTLYLLPHRNNYNFSDIYSASFCSLALKPCANGIGSLWGMAEETA